MGAVSASRVAREVAPALTAAARAAYDSGTTVYGGARPSGVRGPVKLVRTGALRSMIAFAAIGSLVRAVLAVPYARYMIGRFGIMPSGDRSAIPPAWRALIRNAESRALSSEWRRAA